MHIHLRLICPQLPFLHMGPCTIHGFYYFSDCYPSKCVTSVELVLSRVKGLKLLVFLRSLDLGLLQLFLPSSILQPNLVSSCWSRISTALSSTFNICVIHFSCRAPLQMVVGFGWYLWVLSTADRDNHPSMQKLLMLQQNNLQALLSMFHLNNSIYYTIFHRQFSIFHEHIYSLQRWKMNITAFWL